MTELPRPSQSAQVVTRKPWTAEVEVTPEQARALIGRSFPELGSALPLPFGAGFDNVAYRVATAEGDLVFRFPRRALGAECLEAELRVLPRLASRLPVAIPDPRWVGEPSEEYPWRFAGYRLLPGRPACDLDQPLDDDQRTALAPSLGRFLGMLHGLSADEVRGLGAPVDVLGRLDPAKRIPQARNFWPSPFEKGGAGGGFPAAAKKSPLTPLCKGGNQGTGGLVGSGADLDPEPLRALVDQIEHIEARGPVAHHRTLVHGDLYARHLLIDDGLLTGVIDWGDVHVGGVAVDLMVVFAFLPASARGAFRDAYRSAGGPAPSDDEWLWARFRALYHSCLVVTYADDVGDEALLREGLGSLRRLADEDR